MDIREYAHKYKTMGFKHNPLLMKKVYHTDVSTSVLVWNEDEFLVELYMIHPNVHIQRHSHPFENIVIHFSGELTGIRENWGQPVTLTDKHHGMIGNPLAPHHWHEFKSGDSGCVFYNISKWENSSEKDSAILKYIGTPLGPIHEKLLEGYSNTHRWQRGPMQESAKL